MNRGRDLEFGFTLQFSVMGLGFGVWSLESGVES